MNIAIVLAGGIGERMGEAVVLKQFMEVCGKPVALYPLEFLNSHPKIDEIIIGCKEENIGYMRGIAGKYRLDKVSGIIPGGDTRQETSYKCVTSLEGKAAGEDIVIIHDAVRPLLTNDIIENNIRLAEKYGAVNTVLPARSTVVHSADGEIISDIPKRNEVYIGQTPQSFQYKVIRDAHRYCHENNISVTVDCSLVFRHGGKVALTRGNPADIKITSSCDLKLFEAFLKIGGA